jgi:hypothetical protein
MGILQPKKQERLIFISGQIMSGLAAGILQ